MMVVATQRALLLKSAAVSSVSNGLRAAEAEEQRGREEYEEAKRGNITSPLLLP